MKDDLLCQCNGTTEDEMIDAAMRLKHQIQAAGAMPSAIEILFHEVHRDDPTNRIRCGSCTQHMRGIIVDLKLRPEFERAASREEADKICDHCATCTGCAVTFDYSPMK